MDLGAVAFRGTTRFRLVRFLGRGGMGVVYEAFDETNAVPVALKLLPVVSPDMLLRFKREFRAVADVRHPNLVRLGELVSEGSQWFFSMELVQGVDLMSYVRGVEPPTRTSLAPLLAADAPTPIVLPGEAVRRYDPSSGLPLGAPPGGNYREERLRPALAQLARALAALHAAGAVHRDVKPSNVLVTAEGRAVLLDFGLVSAASIETTQSGAGTPEYMAPEQVAMQPVSGAADWYAFGVILFELLSGRLPFEGLPHEILYRKQHGRAPRVAALAPGVPADLAALCDRLLEADPELRASGPEVLAALAPAPVGRTIDPPPAPRDDAVRFVGRESELDAMEATLDAVRKGDGARVLIVRGESGVGKSALVRAFLETRLETNENAPPILLTARCYERELLPFKALDGLVDVLTGLLRQLDPDTIARIVPDRAAVLLQAFPVLGRVPLIAHAPHQHVGPDPREVRASMFVVFRQLLRALGERAPIVAYVDDLQWADADSVALLSEVLRPPDAPRLLLLGTLRTQAAGDPAGRFLAADVPEEELALSNLGGDAARMLARELLLSGGASDPDRGADVLARESSGHPLFLLELARTAHLRRGNGAHLTLDSVLRAQIESFPEATVRVLRTLAISGAPTPVRMLRRLCDLDGPTAVRLFDELRSARLVYSVTERGDELLDFSHDRIRQVARQSTSSAVARDLHEKLAEAFEDASNSLRAGGHWREAGHPDRAAVHFSSAARRAAEALAFDRAIASYTDALALGNWSEEQRREMLVGLGDALSNVGRGAEAAANYLAAARSAGPVQAMDLRRRGAEELIRSGHLDEGRAVADEALADAGMRFPRSPVRALIAERAALFLRGRRFKRRSAEEIAPRELARADLCWSISSGLGLMDPVQGAHFQVRSLRLALSAGEPYRVSRGIAGEAAYAAAQGNGPRAQKLLGEASAIAAELNHPHASGIVSLMSGLAAHLGGRFASALDHLATAERIFRDRCVGAAWELNAVRHFTLECFYYLGALERFRSEAAEGLKEAHDRGSVYASTTLRIGLANAVWLLGDDPERASQETREAMAAWSAQGYHIQHWYQLIAETQVDLYRGDGESAYQRFVAGWPALRRSLLLQMQHTRIVAIHLRGRAALAGGLSATGSERTARLRLARECANRLRRGSGWGCAMAALLHAGIEQAEGHAAEAAAWIRRAIDETGAHELALFKAAAQMAAGTMGGDAATAAAGETWMRASGAKTPHSLARMLAPGIASG
ncbi:MAG TPA: protein kinase [Polyangia bacterium]|nr:protein kinase [Polyangia bacterium]